MPADRQKIFDLLQQSVNLQEDAKFVGASGTGFEALAGYALCRGVTPFVGVPVGLVMVGGSIYLAVRNWKTAGDLNRQAEQ